MAEHAGLLLAALLIDAALGEPRWLWSRWPHPAVLMGRAVAALDRGLNTGGLRRAKGALATAVLGLGALALGGLVAALPLGPLWEVLAAAVLLAQKSLAEHVAAVAQGLRYGLAEGRRAVARIVGRDPATLDEAGVARAAIESAAENFSDGVAAPAFWFLLGGLPGVLLYKVTNTADSMIGYRTARHADFGWAAARFDDLLNWVPARLSAGLIALVFWSAPALSVIGRDARLHRSPNAGWPEAAMAGVLGVALSGPRSYDGEMRDYPFVNPAGRRAIGAAEIDGAVAVLWRAWAGLAAAAALIWLAG